jgi:hypothetical protein
VSIEVEPESGNQIPAKTEVRFYSVERGVTLEEIYNEYSGQ